MILVGQLATADGLTATETLVETASGIELRVSGHYAPAAAYRRHQPTDIPVDVDHAGRDVGHVRYLEQADQGLFAVCEIEVDALTGLDAVYLSAECEHRGSGNRHTDIELRAVGLVASSATVGKSAAVLVPGTLADGCRWSNRTPRRGLLDRAAEYHERHRFTRRPHVIADRRTIHVERVDGDLWVDSRGRQVPVVPDPYPRQLLPRSNSGRYRTVNGHEVEIEHWPARPGSIIAVR